MTTSFSFGCEGSDGVVGKCSCEGMQGLCEEAANALVVDTVFLVVSSVVAGEAEWFFRCGIAKRKMVEFLEEGESIKVVEGVDKVSFLFVYDGVGSSDVFEGAVCLVCTV